jgi:hypothetical protein
MSIDRPAASLVLAEQVGDVADREDGCVGATIRLPDFAAPSAAARFHGSSWSILWAGCSAIRARTSANQACGSTLFNLAVTIRL